jgi:flavin reductase (DIM6/NTAB) family NADH-FMN oxidoreductase RutF
MVHPLTPDAFRRAMGRFATGVTVVTTMYHGEPAGATVSAFCSVSLDPLLVLISLSESSRTYACIRQSGRFAVNLLRARQQPIAERFGRPDQRDKVFFDIPHHLGAMGSPLFDGSLAGIECWVARTYPGGDHALLLGAVAATEIKESREDDPLLYYRSAFRTLQPGTLDG